MKITTPYDEIPRSSTEGFFIYRVKCCFALLIMVLSLSACSVSQRGGLDNLRDEDKSDSEITPKNHSHPFIIFISDTQSPMKIETLWLKYTDNDKATARLFAEIVSEKGADAVFHLGDIVAVGSSSKEWETAGKHLLKLKEAGLPFYPIPGNHEYMFFPDEGMEYFHKGFPELSRTWYTVRDGPLAIVLLNSNFSQITNEELSNQRLWYEEQLRKLDNDPSVRAVIVATHHPPYTNSKIVQASSEVQKEFVPLFSKYRKSRLFISGHAHAFEHFREQGKDFLVIGGGGGLLHPLRTGSEQKRRGIFSEKTDKRFFHYITCSLEETGLEVSVKMLRPDQSGFEVPYRLIIPLKDN
ncbi:MAG TPA: metallophosphoesterase [Thermodesulfovibrionales bacterium]|nr:metallophosphoesterase [Thermodesulfovibrionales bacterium]